MLPTLPLLARPIVAVLPVTVLELAVAESPPHPARTTAAVGIAAAAARHLMILLRVTGAPCDRESRPRTGREQPTPIGGLASWPRTLGQLTLGSATGARERLG